MTIANIETGELANVQPAQITQQSAAVVQIHEWAAELQAAHALGSALASSSFLPQSLRKKGKDSWKTTDELANDAAAVILAGKSVGMDPMQAVQNIFPVHGMPSMYARSMTALVISNGHHVERVEATDQSVTWRGRRRGTESWQTFTWTIDRAKKAGYTSNAKYTSDPIGMLSAKAAAEMCRVMFPDVLLGMAYSVEDLELEPDVESAAEVSPAKPKTRVARKRKDAAPDPVKPPLVDTPPAEDDDPEGATEPDQDEQPADEAPETITKDRWDEVKATLAQVGVTTAAEIRQTLTEAAGRPIQKWQDLTPAEADEVEATIQDALNGTNDPQED